MRWRTMPWLVALFGLMIAPLGITSIFFIIIQPLLIGTWSTIALIGAAAILLQIPYSLDELLATLQFLRRRAKAGQNWLRVLFMGDTDEMRETRNGGPVADEFEQSPGAVIKHMFGGGVSLPWNLALVAVIGLSLLFTRITLGADGNFANAHHVIGSLVLTVVSLAAAEVARPLRYLNVPLGAVLMAVPFMFGASVVASVATMTLGAGLIVLSIRRGTILTRYGSWNRLMI